MTVDVLKRARLETAIWAAKLLLLCVGTVSTLVFFKAAIIPYLLNLAVSIVPQLTSFKSCFLSPLYIYIILNFIIITIAVSSTFQRQNQNLKQHQQPSSSSFSFVAFSSFISDNAAKTVDNIDSGSNYIYSPDNNSSIQSQSYSQQQQQQPTIQSHSKEDAALLFSPSSHDNRRHSNNEMISCPDMHIVQADDDNQEAAAEDDADEDQGFDPSPEMRFGNLLTKSVEMRRLEVEVGEQINTLDMTWKAIMEGQGKAISKHLKKSDTWDTPPRLTQLALTRTKFKGVLEHQLQLHHSNLDGDGDDDGGHGEDDAVTWARRELKKSDTFSDRVSLRREKSMTQEELNQRAEAFIKKFNNDIRLQRLESDQRRFKEVVNRGL